MSGGKTAKLKLEETRPRNRFDYKKFFSLLLTILSPLISTVPAPVTAAVSSNNLAHPRHREHEVDVGRDGDRNDKVALGRVDVLGRDSPIFKNYS
jgi:hypothetical protein